ncbi:hypothetical protein BDV96DRAFT_592460 [Lophiotrema nucula]|uniref:Clr5 domain-containing protein n=1 Tax=Lophiotrema nucula TaxID=690887 RepID=A0A6A5YEG1_9PLEO|nr:hypothetical protein BDV96DRAFT_592460 [Lophiotrema nucula]
MDPFSNFSWNGDEADGLPSPFSHEPKDFDTTSGFPETQQSSFDAGPSQDEHSFISTSSSHSQQDGLGRDAVMEDVRSTLRTSTMLRRDPPVAGPRRLKYGDLDWDSHRDKIYQLYIEDGLTLTETMRNMKDEHFFDAPAKLYKEKFKVWHWQKNLPGKVAHWMVNRATLREADNKNTVFEYGGQRWTVEEAISRANRSKRIGKEPVSTPADVDVITPENHGSAASPTASDVILIRAHTGPTQRILPLNFNGKSREDLASLLHAARQYARSGEAITAEDTYIEVFNGCEHILSATHEDTVKVGYELATFYTQQERKVDADDVLEEMAEKHISQLGINNQRTQQLLLNIAELLNSWNRDSDAMAFLNRAWDIAKSEKKAQGTANPTTSKNPVRRGRRQADSSGVIDQGRLQNLVGELIEDFNAPRINHGLAAARAHASANDPAVETLLKAIETQCLRHPTSMTVQGLRARAELLKLYLKQRSTVQHQDAFSTAPNTFRAFWLKAPWNSETFKSHEVIEASLELTSAILRNGMYQEARWMFREIEKKTTFIFGIDDERTIWMWISIGLIYQTYMPLNWGEAQPWFERANAAAYNAWGFNDGVTKSLEKGLQKKHFSYINDEGRPYKSIFGVIGMTVRPMRLHLE